MFGIVCLLDAVKQMDVIYRAMPTAFDKGNHETLLNKLNNCFSISGKELHNYFAVESICSTLFR
jgi:hypothetical protein